MIDARRWVLAEAWLAAGLRVEWCPSYRESEVASNAWQQDEETGERYFYGGDRTWYVLHKSRVFGYAPPFTAPALGTEALKHELAHYLAATPDERQQRNFGLPPDTSLPDGEDRALRAEAVIDAMLGAACRIASLALTGRAG